MHRRVYMNLQSDSMSPVSYTHLDVYKRQGIYQLYVLSVLAYRCAYNIILNKLEQLMRFTFRILQYVFLLVAFKLQVNIILRKIPVVNYSIGGINP